jgi:hypothetical protein
MAFEISNEVFLDSLFADKMIISFTKDDGASIMEQSLSAMLSTLQVLNYQASLLNKTNVNIPLNMASLNITGDTQNPLEINFNNSLFSVAPGTKDTLLVMADFMENARLASFKTRLNSLNVFDDDATIPVSLVTSSGAPFIGSDSAVTSNQSLLSSDAAKNFFVYPNPFGRGSEDYLTTRFNFSVDNVSDVTVSVFTLLGELVWRQKQSNIPKGPHPNRFRWDGKNGNGKEVLNGVYIGVIEIRPVDGGAVKRYTTKIAYIK